MQGYSDVIKRIGEIIKLSNERFHETKEDEIKNNFTYILHTYISNEYVKELTRLLELEEIAMLLQQEEVFKLNNDLMQVALEKSSDMIYGDLWQRLYNMLKAIGGCKVSDLKEYNGYLIRKEDYTDFLEICSLAKIGPFSPIANMGVVETKERVRLALDRRQKQEQRINNYLHYQKEKENKRTLFKHKYANIIILGINGKLTKDMIILFRDVMNSEDYADLLSDLLQWQIIKEQDLNELKYMTPVSSVDDLVSYFASKEDLNVEALALLMPSLGEVQYNYLIDELFKLNVIKVEDYLLNLKRYLNIDQKDNEIKISSI